MKPISRLSSGRVVVKPPVQVSEDRYQLLDLASAEPNLGTAANGSVLTTTTTGQRVWTKDLSINNATVSTNLVAGTVYTDNLLFANGDPYISETTQTNIYNGNITIGTSVTLVDTVPAAGVSSVRWTATARDNINGTLRSSTIDSVNDGITTYYNEYGVVLSDNAAEVAVFTSTIEAGNINLYALGESDQVTITYQRTTLGTGTLPGYIAGAGYIQNVVGSGTATTCVVDTFTGTGSQTNYTLSATPSNENQVIAVVAGVVQPKSVYTVSGAVLTFSAAPDSGVPVEFTTFVTTTITGYAGSAGSIGYTGSSGTFSGVVTGDLSVSGTTFVTGDIIPTSNNTVNIGSPTSRFGTLYLAANTIDLGGTTISTSPSGDLTFVTSGGSVDITANTINFLSTVATTEIAPGESGPIGYTGSRGTDGIIGTNGAIGYTGSKGDTGLGFAIAKTYSSVAALTADTSPTGIVAGQFAVIETGNVNDAENSRLYLWNGSAYSYVSDLSGAAGFTGPAGTTGFTGSAGTNGFTGSGGTGFTGSAGTNATNGTATFVATGTIGNGTVVALNSDGTVSVVAQSDINLTYTNQVTISGSSWGTQTSYNPLLKAVYNSTNNLLYIVYWSGDITVEIGTITGNTISFTARTSIANSIISGAGGLDAHWNPVANVLVIVGSGSGGSGHYVTATHRVSPSLGLTFSSATQWMNGSSGNGNGPRLLYNSTNDSYVFFYKNSSDISARALKLGTGLGTPTSIVTGFSSSNILLDAVYDAINNQAILAYSGPGLTSSFVKTVTVTGTSLSQGSATAFLASQLYGSIDIAVNSTGTGLLILHDSGNGKNATAGTISGSTFTFGSSTVINSSTGNASSDLIFDVISGRYIAMYNHNSGPGEIVDITVSGTTVTKNTTVSSVSSQFAVNALYIPSLQKTVVASGPYISALVAGIINPFRAAVTNAGSWIGIAANAASNGGSTLVTTLGGVNTSVTGLTTNTVYYVNPAGGITTTPTSYGKIGIATASNKILLSDTNYGYTGSQGNIGFTGSTGTTGFTGSSGGTGFTGSASAGGAGDVFFNNTSLLLHFDGTNGQTKTIDSSGAQTTLTFGAAAALSSTRAKFGTTSLLTNTTAGSLVSTTAASQGSPLDLSTGGIDWTVELWAYPTALPSGTNEFQGVMLGWGPVGFGAGWAQVSLNLGAGGSWAGQFNSDNSSTGDTSIGSLASATLNTWTHLALTRSGNTAYFFVNGVLQGTSTRVGNGINFSASSWLMGRGSNDTYRFIGHIDEVRITKGVARYTSNFTVPGTAFPDFYSGIGYTGSAAPLNLPTVNVSNAYTLSTADIGDLINITTGGVTVPSGVFVSGDVVTIYNNSAVSQTVTQGASVTMYLVGTATTGNRTLAQRGLATVLCVGTNTFVISGGGLT